MAVPLSMFMAARISSRSCSTISGRLIPGGYRRSYRAVAIWQLDRLDDLGAALSSPGGRMAELPVLSNCARAVAVEQVNGQQVREMSVIFTTDLHRFRSSVRSRAPSGPVGSSRHRSRAGSRLETSTSTCSSPMRIGRSGSRELSNHRGAFRADETGRQQVTSAGHQTYRHARASTITTRTIIKLISAHKLSVRLWSLLSCIVMGDDLPSGRQPHG